VAAGWDGDKEIVSGVTDGGFRILHSFMLVVHG
jgi:hypothetical protein